MKKSELREMIREEINKLNEAEWKIINTGEKTINKKIKNQLNKLFPNIKPTKKHVPQSGYVYYYKDKSGKNIGMVSIEKPHGVVIRTR
jgi:hypothetical protein